MKSMRLFRKRCKENDIQLTDNINNALWLLGDGTMLDGQFDFGIRGQDHRVIFGAVDYGDYYQSNDKRKTHWDRIHKEYKAIRLCPETNTALVTKYQRLTDVQRSLLAEVGFNIEKY